MLRLALLLLSLALPFPALAHMVLVEGNVNLREDPSTKHPPIRLLKPPGEAMLLNHVREKGYYRVLTRQDEIGWVWWQRIEILPEYERDHWKHWTDADSDCQKARNEVLIAESEIPVTFFPRSDGKRCKVETGRWTDPYGGEVFTDPKDLDVDHLVPLKNAHVSGGWEWTRGRREDYANDLGNTEHLVAVKASLNRQKGSKGPDEWKPPDQGSWCWYARSWEGIKERWGLSMTQAEVSAVEEMKEKCS